MGIEEIEKYIHDLIDQSLQGQSIEHPKLDFKRQWYDLTDEKEKAAFIKDTSSMANTVGLDGFIVIGFDEKECTFHPTKFSDCKLNDTSQLPDMINRHVDRVFDIRYYPITVHGHILNVLHIPPSLDKPHVIRLHRSWPKNGQTKEEKHKVFIRKNTKTEEANKYDFDFMYYDKKNILPEYDIHGFIDLASLNLRVTPGPHEVFISICTRIHGQLSVTLENSGRRPISVKEIMCELSIFEDDPTPGQYLTIKSTGTTDNCILRPNDISHIRFFVEANNLNGYPFDTANSKVNEFLTNQKHLYLKNFVVNTTNGFALYPKSTNK